MTESGDCFDVKNYETEDDGRLFGGLKRENQGPKEEDYSVQTFVVMPQLRERRSITVATEPNRDAGARCLRAEEGSTDGTPDPIRQYKQASHGTAGSWLDKVRGRLGAVWCRMAEGESNSEGSVRGVRI